MTDNNRRHWLREFSNFYIHRKIFRRNVPLFASFKLTYRCNLSCSGCPFHRRASEPGSIISWNDAVRALDVLRSRGTRIVVFEGGEPLLWSDGGRGLPELAAHARKLFHRVAVTTNGTLGLDVPADAVWLSMDGLQEVHDRLRSRSYERIWSNLNTAAVNGRPRVMVHFTMNRLNWHDLEGLAEKLKGHPAVRGISVQLFYPYGQGESELELTGPERRLALENVIRLKAAFPIINSRHSLQAMIRNSWRCHDDLLINVDPDGTITQGCYVKGRGHVDCSRCGFTPVAEASAALDLHFGAILAGWKAYLR